MAERVERFEMIRADGAREMGGTLHPRDDGFWVRYSDYEKLEGMIVKQKAELQDEVSRANAEAREMRAEKEEAEAQRDQALVERRREIESLESLLRRRKGSGGEL